MLLVFTKCCSAPKKLGAKQANANCNPKNCSAAGNWQTCWPDNPNCDCKPSVSTSLILGNNQSFEPYTSNIYKRRVLSGEFVVVNKHLLEDLVGLNLWDNNMKEEIIRANGSIQKIDKIPKNLKDIYKTVWEMDAKDIIDMTRHRGYFVDQSQSLNLFIKDPDVSKLTSAHFYAWKSGLKTGMFYLNTKSAVDGTYFSLTSGTKGNRENEQAIKAEEFKVMVDLPKNIRPDTIV